MEVEPINTAEELSEEAFPDTAAGPDGTSIEPGIAMRTLLLDPINLVAYKKEYGTSNSGSAGERGLFNTPEEEGFMYRYMLFHKLRNILPQRPSESFLFSHFVITVFKYGTEVGGFYDENEELMAIECGIDNPTLGEMNVYGMTRDEVIGKFGPPQIISDDLIFYQYQDRVLGVHFEHEKVNWYKFICLNPSIDLKTEIPDFFSWRN